MATSVLQIIIKMMKTGGADQEAISSLYRMKAGIGQVTAVAGAMVGAYFAVDQILKQTVGTFVDYETQVEKVKELTGATAEESSKLIQLADDMGVSYESLAKSMKLAAKDGIQSNISGLAELSDEYIALAPGVERTQFLLDKFGKSGTEMARVLMLGGDGIRQLGDGMKGALILTDESIRKAEEYKQAQDELNDSWEEMKVGIGEKLTPALTGLLDAFNKGARANEIMIEQYGTLEGLTWDQRTAARAQAEAELEAERAIKDVNKAMLTTVPTLAEWTAQQTALNSAITETDYGDLLDSTLNLQKGFDDFAQSQADVNAEMAATQLAFDAGTIDADEYGAKMNDLTGKLNENAAAHEAWAKQMIFSMIQARLAVGGTTEDEFAFLMNIGTQMGLVDTSTATMATNLNKSLSSIDLTKPQEYANLWQDVIAQSPTVQTEVQTEAENVTAALMSIDTGKLDEIHDKWQAILDMPVEVNWTVNITQNGNIPDPTGGSSTQMTPTSGRVGYTSTTNNQRSVNVFNPTFVVGSGREALSVLEALR